MDEVMINIILNSPIYLVKILLILKTKNKTINQ